jgi:pyruvate/2-oxoglutarate/acetoin dehydrogenase E1 component
MSEDERICVIGEDILDPYGGAFKVTKGLSTAFPGRVIGTPVSEAGITGLSIGMAIRGLRPILEIMFGDFITLCADQIINSAAKFSWMYNGQVSVPLVIRTPMGGRKGYGPTHSQTIETLFLNVPGLTIIAPSNFHNPGELLSRVVLNENSLVLFIENKHLYYLQLTEPDINGMAGSFFCRIVSDNNERYPTISLMPVKDELPKVTLVTYGGMAPLVSEAALNVFIRDEIVTEVIIPSLIKPLPLHDVLQSVYKSKNLIIIEEAVRTSGWGAELSSQIYENSFNALLKPIYRIGARESPVPSSRSLEEGILPQLQDIEKAIYQQLEN